MGNICTQNHSLSPQDHLSSGAQAGHASDPVYYKGWGGGGKEGEGCMSFYLIIH